VKDRIVFLTIISLVGTFPDSFGNSAAAFSRIGCAKQFAALYKI